MEIDISGKTLEEAIENACSQLGKEKGDFTYEIVEYPKAGFLGIGSKPAVIRVSTTSDPEALASDFLKELFSLSGVPSDSYSLDIRTGDDEKIEINITGEALDMFTRRQGEAVEAIQLMLALALNRQSEEYRKVSLDINNNKEKVVGKLEALAVKTSKQVLRTRRKITLNPMSAYQRRIIHAKLQGVENITTFSIGDEPNRKVVVAYQWPEGKRPQNKFDDRRPRPSAPSQVRTTAPTQEKTEE